MIFVDTSAWFASVVTTDSEHLNATRWLLRARGERRRALVLGEQFFHSGICEICFVAGDDLSRAWEVFRQYDDKDWSFTDCASKAVIERLDIKRAFSFDHHFRQFGRIEVVPWSKG